jgi:hypothetical protein
MTAGSDAARGTAEPHPAPPAPTALVADASTSDVRASTTG